MTDAGDNGSSSAPYFCSLNRIVDSADAMTADWAYLPQELLESTILQSWLRCRNSGLEASARRSSDERMGQLALKEEQESFNRARQLMAFVGLSGVGDELAQNLPYGAQRRLDGVGEAEVLHAAPVPGRLQEEAAPEDPHERPRRDLHLTPPGARRIATIPAAAEPSGIQAKTGRSRMTSGAQAPGSAPTPSSPLSMRTSSKQTPRFLRSG